METIAHILLTEPEAGMVLALCLSMPIGAILGAIAMVTQSQLPRRRHVRRVRR